MRIGLDPIKFAPDFWLSGLLGKAAWNAVRHKGLTASEITQPHFASVKIFTDSVKDVRTLEGEGFRVVDVNMTFRKRVYLSGRQPPWVRHAVPEDRASVLEIARSAFKFSRFHLDPEIQPGVADTVKAEWVENYFRKMRGDAMVVAEHDGRVVGFCQILAPQGQVVIDLIAVREGYTRKGHAKAMLDFAAWRGMQNRSGLDVVVGTQAANIPSMRLYESMGFRIEDTKYVMHRHA